MNGASNPSIPEVLASLEAQASFHREREAFHAEHEARHREHRTAHAAELQEILRRLEAFRSAAAEAMDLAARQVPPPAAPSAPEMEPRRGSRPRIQRLLEKVIADLGADEPFGPLALTAELNRQYGARLRRPIKASHVTTALGRLEQKGIVRLVRKGRPHLEALFARRTTGDV
jgi:hypothetical protein